VREFGSRCSRFDVAISRDAESALLVGSITILNRKAAVRLPHSELAPGFLIGF
jgi:hypothetical protein